jgi:predicted acetyltransferase
MSKGSRPRPFSVSQQEFANSFDKIFRKPDPRQLDDFKAEDEAFENIVNVYNNKRLVSKFDKMFSQWIEPGPQMSPCF